VENTVNEAGNEGVAVTVALPDCARHLTRLRPSYGFGFKICFTGPLSLRSISERSS
jgi:hypothetical protein